MPIRTTLSFLTDLDRGVTMQPIRPALLTHDQQAHRFSIACTRSGAPVDVTGASVSGYFIRADGVTVPITGAVEEGCAALTLPAACYTRNGRFSLIIKLALEGCTSTIFWGEGHVAASRTDAMIDPEDIVPDLTALLAQIEVMEAASAKASAAAQQADAAAQAARSTIGSGAITLEVTWEEINALPEVDRPTVLEAAQPVLTDGVQAIFDSLTDGGSATLTVEGTDYTLRRLGDVTDTLLIKDGVLHLCRKITEDGATLNGGYLFEPIPCTDLTTLFASFLLPCSPATLLSGKVSQVSYAACGAYLDGTHDDYEAMYRAHFIGEKCRCDVVQHGGTIYKANSGWLYVNNHNVDLSGSTILIDGYNRYGTYWLGGQTHHTTEGLDLGDIKQFATRWSSAETGYQPNGLFILTHPGDTTRYNAGEITTEDRKEIVRHGMDGYVYSPAIDDARQATQVTFCRYPATQLTFRGCTLEFDVSFASVAVYFLRCERSNVILRDFLIHPNRRTTQNIGYRGSVFTLNNCADVTMENIKGINIAGRPTETAPRGVAGYLLNAVCVLDLTVRDCNLLGYWGCVGLNGAKEVTFEGCELNRVDVHDYFANVTIHNCRIYGQTLNFGYGKGALNISNCQVLTDWVHQLVNLRCDYGRYFEGEINISNVDAVYTGEGIFDLVSGVTLYSAESAAASGLFMTRYPAIHVSGVTLRLMGESLPGYVFHMPADLESAIAITDKRKVIEFSGVTVFDEGGILLDLPACSLEGIAKCSALTQQDFAAQLNDFSARLAAMENSAGASGDTDYLYYSKRTLAYSAANTNIRLTLPYEDAAAIYKLTVKQLEGDDVTVTVTDWTTSHVAAAGEEVYIRVPSGAKSSGKVVIFAVYPGTNAGSYELTVERTALTDGYTGAIQVDFAAQ